MVQAVGCEYVDEDGSDKGPDDGSCDYSRVSFACGDV